MKSFAVIALLCFVVVDAQLLIVGVRMPSLVNRLPQKWQRKLTAKRDLHHSPGVWLEKPTLQDLQPGAPQKSPGVYISPHKPALQDLVPAAPEKNLLKPLTPVAVKPNTLWKNFGRVPTLVDHNSQGYVYAACMSFDQVPAADEFEARLILVWRDITTHRFQISYDGRRYFALDSRQATPLPLRALGVIMRKGAESRHGFEPQLIKNGRFVIYIRTMERLVGATLEMGAPAFRGVPHNKIAQCPKIGVNPHGPATTTNHHSSFADDFVRQMLFIFRGYRVFIFAVPMLAFVFILALLAKKRREARMRAAAAAAAAANPDVEEAAEQRAPAVQYPAHSVPVPPPSNQQPRVIYQPVYYAPLAQQPPVPAGMAPPAYSQVPYPNLNQ